MVMRDDDFSTDLRSTESASGDWSFPSTWTARPPRDFQSLYDRERVRAARERARADAAEARCEELRWAEVAARSDAGSWKSRFEASRQKRQAAVEEAKEARRAAKDALSSEAEVARLKKLLADAGVDTGKGVAVAPQRMTAQEPRAHQNTPRSRSVRQLRKALETTQTQKDTIRALRYKNSDLRKAVKEAESQKGTIRALSGMIERLRARLRDFQDQKDTIRLLSWQVDTLRLDLDGLRRSLKKSEEEKKTLSQALSGADADHRKALRRSRRQKTTIKSLSRKNARLRKDGKALRNRIEALEADIARLRSTGATLSKRLYGRKSEQKKKPRSERKRGQQRGAPGHGRTQRPGLEERPEELVLPPDACVCGQCGQPYVPNGAEESTLVEIEVKAYKRVIRRPRLRRDCECASSPMEVSAPPVPRLFRGTPYGIGFWARFLFELCVCLRPVHRIAAWMSAHGLAISAGTLANSLKRFVPLFEPLFEAILAHQNKAILRHADETSWRVQELRGEDRSSRAWLWTSVSNDAVCFHIDASRSAEAAEKLFAGIVLYAVIVCDRYSAYKKLARMLGGLVTLAFCWSHMRRDFIDCAAGQEQLTQWCEGWIERIAEIYRLNDTRLGHYDPGLKHQTPAFDAAQTALNGAVDTLFAQAERELAALSDKAREGKALRSLLNHRDGLCVFVDRPLVPLDNNLAERFLRGPAIGRRLSHGSDSEDGAKFTAIMYSVVGTLSMNGIDVLRWLEAWLTACAKNGRKPPDDLSPWLPWSMSEERRREFLAPG